MDEIMGVETVLDEIRRWLKSGATIRATNPHGRVLEISVDGTIYGGMTIEWDADKLLEYNRGYLAGLNKSKEFLHIHTGAEHSKVWTMGMCLKEIDDCIDAEIFKAKNESESVHPAGN